MIHVHYTCHNILTTAPPRCTMRLLLVMLSAFWACLWSWDGWDKGMHRSSHQFRNNPYNHGCRVTDQNLPILTCKLNNDQFGRIHPKHPKAAKNLPLLWSDDVVVYWRKLPAREQLHVAWYPAFLPKAWHHKSVELDNRIIVVIDCWPSMLLMLGLSNPNTYSRNFTGNFTVMPHPFRWHWMEVAL